MSGAIGGAEQEDRSRVDQGIDVPGTAIPDYALAPDKNAARHKDLELILAHACEENCTRCSGWTPTVVRYEFQ